MIPVVDMEFDSGKRTRNLLLVHCEDGEGVMTETILLWVALFEICTEICSGQFKVLILRH